MEILWSKEVDYLSGEGAKLHKAVHSLLSHTGAKSWMGPSPAACAFRHPFHTNSPEIYQTHHKFHLKKVQIFLCLLSDGCYHHTQH